MLSFHVKFVQTDGWITVKQYARDLSTRGHKNVSGDCHKEYVCTANKYKLIWTAQTLSLCLWVRIINEEDQNLQQVIRHYSSTRKLKLFWVTIIWSEK